MRCCIDECALNRNGERCGASNVLIRFTFSGGMVCDFFENERLEIICSD